MESKRTATTYFIPPGKFLLMENALGNPDLIQSSVSSDCRVTIVDSANFPLDELEQWPTFRLTSADIKLKLGNGAYYIYIVVPTPDNTESTSAFISYNTALVDRDGYEVIETEDEEGNPKLEKGELLGKSGFKYYQCGVISARGGNASATTSPSGQGRLLEMDLGVTPSPSTLPGDLNDFDKIFKLDKVDPGNVNSWLLTILLLVKQMAVRLLRVTDRIIFGEEGKNEKPITDIKRSVDSDNEFILNEDGTQIKDPNYVPISDETIPTTKYLHSVTDERFLRKDKDDRSVGTISSDKGFEVGNYVPGELGIGGIFKIDENGDSYIEVDKALFRKIAYFVEIMIKKLSHVGGSIILSPASMKCSKVEEHETYYRCYFENEHEGKTINQEFVVGDQARSQEFNIKEGLSQNVRNQYYWRLVVGVGSNYIDLSKADCDSGSGIPLSGDDIVQLGNRDNPSRQRAIILSSYGEGTPSIIMYKGIKSYSMSDAKMPLRLSPDGNIIEGDFISKSGKNLEEMFLEAKVDWDKVLEQTDKEFSMWFFPYAPSSDVAPEVDWATPELKALHEEDLFYNTDDESEDGGKAWRYTFKDGSYVWEIVTDAETIKALEKASKAQETADEKIRNFITEDNVLPIPPYDKGDRWSNANFVEGDVIHAEDDDMVCITPKAKGEEPSINDWRHASAMNSETRHSYDAQIKNLGDSIQLTVEKTDKLTKDVAQLGVELDGVSEQVRIYASKLSFDSNGNVTNISKSGLVTTSNYASIFSQYKSQTGAVVQSEISAFVTEGDVGDMISKITITADNVDINNGVVIIDKNSAKIGHFNISQKGLDMDSNNDGYIKFDFSGNKFVRINAGDSALFYGRHDSGTIMELNSYGSSATALKLRCNSSGIGFALDGLGNTLLQARYNTNKTYMEEVTIAGLALSYKYGNSLQTPTNPTMPITTNMWVDFIVLTGNLTLPVAGNCHGKLLFVKCSSSYTLTVYDCVENQDSYTDYDTSNFKDNQMRAFFSAGSRWFELNLTDTW